MFSQPNFLTRIFLSSLSLFAGSLYFCSISIAQSNTAVETLIKQSEFAQSTADWKKAKNGWDKVLLSDRNHPGALKGLYYNQLQAGNVSAAKDLLDRFELANPEHPTLDSMTNDLRLVEDGLPTLQSARNKVNGGQITTGLELYRISFGRVEPNGPLALEFYTTLGGTESGWSQAETGLKRLYQNNPEDWTYELAYAKHLTYNERKRSDGIATLIRLASEPKSRSASLPALRESIRWLKNSHSNINLFEDYLSLVDDDKEISEQLLKLRSSRTPAQEKQLQRGFTAMQEDSLEKAAEGFRRLLRSRPSDSDALAGLGIVELRLGNFDESKTLLRKALKSYPRQQDWRRSYNSARYWSEIEKARSFIETENNDNAIANLEKAITIKPTEEVGLVLLAETLYKLGRINESESYFKEVIEINPLNAVALRGLGELYNQTNRFEEAKRLALKLNRESNDESDPVADGIIAQSHVARARTLMKQNELDLAQVELEKAQKAQSYNPWITLELAQLLIRRQRPDRARLLMSELESQDPISDSALHALAEFAHLQNRNRDALNYLERIPVENRTPQMASTQNRVWMRLQVKRSVQFAQNNEFSKARKTLGKAENFAGSQPTMAGALASGWVELGQEERALSIMRTAMKLDPDVWLQLQYAGLLLKVQKNKELKQVIQNLQARSDLDEFQIRELSHIEVSLALRQSDQYLRDEQYAKAYASIDPFIDWEDNYPNVRMMLGRLYQKTGDLDQAMASYNKILREHPNHLDARRSAVGLLIDRKLYKDAQVLVDDGLILFPTHPRMVLLAGQLESANNRPKQALAYYKQALVLVASEPSDPYFQETNFKIPDENDVLSSSSGSTSLLDFLDAPEALALENAVGLREEILTEIGRVNAKTSNQLEIGGELRNRSGTAGLDKLTMFRIPLKFNFGIGNTGRMSLQVAAESLNADDIQLSNAEESQRFGSLSLDTSLPREETLSISENGASINAGYESKFFSFDIGSTPSDYAITNTVGGISATNAGSKFKVTGSVSQRAMEDSILSYAGQLDPFLGLSWGGVIKTGGDIRFVVDRQNQGFYGSVGGYSLEGENVASNSMNQFGAGIFWRIRDTATSELRLGLDIDSFAYDKNLSFYTFGHGGYFSPQSYINIGIPIQWRGDTGPMQYTLTGKIGFERYEQDDVDYFPNDANLQLQLEELAIASTESLRTIHEGSKDTGVSISLTGHINYQISSKISIGSTMRLQRSGDYNESRIGLFARYYFSPQEVKSVTPSNQPNQVISFNR